jgi:putative membrane-bound dehydrogenase-like protein
MNLTQINRNNYLLTIIVLTVLLMACSQKSKYPGPLSPEEEMKTFRFADDFRVELFASEPLVKDPVSMIFDNNGDAYVVEMADANMRDSLKGRGQIVLLRDTDKDGKADTAIIFAKGLKEATTLLPWKEGLIVTAAPNILYLKDTDGDGVADVKDTLFTGFFTGNDEAQITSLRFSVDNWIYANNHNQPGKVVSYLGDKPDTLNMLGADFRFRLDTRQFERTTGPGQYGQAIDDWGHRFFTENSLHIRQVVIPARYLNRNPYLPKEERKAIENISDHDPIMYQISATPYWRQVRTDRRNKAFQERGLKPTEYAREHFTGASGGTFYGAEGLGPEYYGNIFTGDVSGNLIHRDVLENRVNPSNPFYDARRGKNEQKKEFLASDDTWFRPTNFAVGPDGYLYVVDMYRQHIETPVSIPEDLQVDMDFAAGSDKGRIYRIMPANSGKYQGGTVDLNKLSSKHLVDLLSSPNRWYRSNAHKLIIERQDKSVLDQVDSLFRKSGDTRVRLEALYIMEGLNSLTEKIVNEALADESSGIRENAAILAERFPSGLVNLERLLDDTSSHVVLQAVLSLGQFPGERVEDDFIKVLRRFGSNSWFRTAVLSSKTGSSFSMYQKLINTSSSGEENGGWKTEILKSISHSLKNEKDNKKE